MDVLAYSAFNQQINLNQQIVNKTSCLSTKCSETAAVQATSLSLGAPAACWLRCIEPCLLRQPQTCALWACIPTLPTTGCPWTSGFKVCNTAGQFNCGFCCQWTVPAGATCARFQLWGAGGGSGVGRCCGGSPFGSSGAYASVIIPVTAGCTYTICSGCAFCCRACANNYNAPESRVPGCPSYVTGPGLCNFCANGGQGRLGTWMASYGQRNTNRLMFLTRNYSGACLCCLGNFYCFSNSCATCGDIEIVAGASYFGTTTTPNIVYGIRGMWPYLRFDTNHYGFQQHPPIYGFESSSQCSLCWTSSCCGAGFRAECGVMQIPGAGGFPSTTFGGCTCGQCGDMGRMGMVCVSLR